MSQRIKNLLRAKSINMPYIPHTEQQIKEMLAVVGVADVEELFDSVPAAVRLRQPFDIPEGLSEQDMRAAMQRLAARNTTLDQCNAFLGAGCYDHYVPAAVPALLARAEFLTAYTPYQPEISQGTLQALYEYQSYMCALTGMDVSNAGLFDGASALAESVLMALRITGRRRVILANTIHPQYRQVVRTYTAGINCVIEEVGCDDSGSINQNALAAMCTEDTACVCAQNPNFFGVVEDAAPIAALAHARRALMVMCVNPFSLAVLASPRQAGADIACGDGQPFGCGLNFGGNSFGFLTTRQEYVRQMPGRIIGRTVDTKGRQAFCLTLAAREQHIRRQHATSNICSNQSLSTIGAAIYLGLMGTTGLTNAAAAAIQKAHYLQERLCAIDGVRMYFSGPFFNEFTWEVPHARRVVAALHKKNIIAGFLAGNDYPHMKQCVISCCTETKTQADIDAYIEAVRKILT